MSITSKEILEYVMETPYNTNGNILKSFLEELVSSNSCDQLINKTIRSINSNVTYIGMYAFRECKNLIEAFFPEVVEIGGAAFSGCINLENIYFPKVENIYTSAFYGNKLTTVDLPKTKYLGSGSFSDCLSLTYINLPNLETIGASVFRACHNLSVIFGKRVNIESTLDDIDESVIFYVQPEDLEWYRNTGGWDILYNNNQIKSIEELNQ